jgi:hypothetical protein
MKNVRSKTKLTLNTETLRHLRGIQLWELRHAQGGQMIANVEESIRTQEPAFACIKPPPQ